VDYSAVVALAFLQFRASEICEWFGLTGKQEIFRSRERDVVVPTVPTVYLNYGPSSGVPVFLALLHLCSECPLGSGHSKYRCTQQSQEDWYTRKWAEVQEVREHSSNHHIPLPASEDVLLPGQPKPLTNLVCTEPQEV